MYAKSKIYLLLENNIGESMKQLNPYFPYYIQFNGDKGQQPVGHIVCNIFHIVLLDITHFFVDMNFIAWCGVWETGSVWEFNLSIVVSVFNINVYLSRTSIACYALIYPFRQGCIELFRSRATLIGEFLYYRRTVQKRWTFSVSHPWFTPATTSFTHWVYIKPFEFHI